jgi:hypothetical protein
MLGVTFINSDCKETPQIPKAIVPVLIQAESLGPFGPRGMRNGTQATSSAMRFSIRYQARGPLIILRMDVIQSQDIFLGMYLYSSLALRLSRDLS